MAFAACPSAKIVGPAVSRTRSGDAKIVIHEMRYGRTAQTWGGVYSQAEAAVAAHGAEVFAQDLREELERETVPAEATLLWRGY